MSITMTRALAGAAATDAGNRSMRRGKRAAWDESDYDAACVEFTRLWGTDDADAWDRDHVIVTRNPGPVSGVKA